MSTENEAPVLEDLLCFDLYATSRQVIAAYRPLLEEAQLTYPQYLVLVSLWERDGITMKQLSIQVHLDYGTISPLVKRLEANGLVQRERSRDDERVVEVTLTAAGRRLEEKAQCIPTRLGAAIGFTEKQAADLRDAVRQLTDALDASTERKPA